MWTFFGWGSNVFFQKQQQQQQQPHQIEGGSGGDAAAGGFANRFAQYWSHFYACKMAERFGLPAPAPLHVQRADAVQQAVEPDMATQESLTNPHTGDTVVQEGDAYAVNPYSQAPHPYAYRDYGWNRPKNEKEREERKKKDEKRRKRDAEKAAAPKEKFDADSDPNYNYGPGGQGREKRRQAQHPQLAQHQRAGAGGAGGGVVMPGQAAPVGQPQALLLPRGRGRVAVASREEAEALTNDEPLVFGK